MLQAPTTKQCSQTLYLNAAGSLHTTATNYARFLAAVGTGVTPLPPHRSRRALLTYPAPTLGAWRRSVALDKGGLSLAPGSSGSQATYVDPTHALFGKSFHVLEWRNSPGNAGFAYVAYKHNTRLYIPIDVTNVAFISSTSITDAFLHT